MIGGFNKLKVLAIILALPIQLFSQTLFVNDNSLTGDVYTSAVGNDNNTGTAASPFLTIAKAITVATAGTTIRVDVGTYGASFTINKNVTLQGANVGVAGYNTRGAETIIQSVKVTFSGSAAIVFDGFYLKQLGSTNGGTLFVNNTPVTIQNCYFERNASSTGITPVGIEMVNSTSPILIQQNYFTGNRSFGYFSSHRTWNSGIYCNGGTNVTITGNRFYGVRTSINLDNPSTGVSINNNDFQEAGTTLSIGGTVASGITYTMNGNSFSVISGLTTFNLSNVTDAFRLNVTNNTFSGVAAASMSIDQCFTLESTIAHKNSSSGKRGLVIYQNGKLYRTSTTTLANNILFAANNDNIYVASGSISESVTIGKPLKLYGNNFNINPNASDWILSSARKAETVITGNNTITIASSNVEINGFRIANSTNLAGNIGIGNSAAENYSNVVIKNNIITNNTNIRAIYFAALSGNSCTGIQISENRIENNTITSPRNGIELQRASGANVSNNFISGSSDHGILIDGFGSHSISGNRTEICKITGIGVQASYSNTQEVTISNNTLSGSQSGITLLSNSVLLEGIKFNINNNRISIDLAKLDANNGGIVIRSVKSGDGSSTNFIQQNQITFSATGNLGSSRYGVISGGPASAAYGIWLIGNIGPINLSYNSINGGNVRAQGVSVSAYDMAAIRADVNASVNFVSGTQTVAFSGTLNVINNDCRDFTHGMTLVNSVTNVPGNIASGSIVTVTNNVLLSASNGKSLIVGSGGNAISANCNWYGTNSNTAILGLLSGNINYSPFLVNGTDNNGSASGFEPTTGACSGYAVSAPSLTASNLVVTSVSQFALGFRLTKGNGSSRLVLCRREYAVTNNPINNNSYSANSVFGSGSNFSDSSFAIYNGTDSLINVNNLLPGNTYQFKVFEYNSEGSAILYLTDPAYSFSIATAEPDNDNDGVPNAADQFPENPNLAFSSTFPSESYNTLLFEDLWPAIGDYDFNDLVISYKYDMLTNASNQLVELNFTFITRAIGGSFHNGFAFQLDGIAPNKISSVSGAKANGAAWLALNSNGTEAEQPNNANIIVFDDAYKLLPTFGGYSFVNVSPGAPNSGTDTAYVSVKFLVNGIAPVGGVIDFTGWSHARINPYIIVNNNRQVEVHLKNRQPSAKANSNLFGSGNDASYPGNNKFYTSKNNLPWALEINSWMPYAIEEIDFSEAYLHFIEWVESNGKNYPLWYINEDGYRNSNKLWKP